MKKYRPRQYVELFHLLFLNQLGRKVNKTLYVLKGGCNMRFFFKSIRYSEDMDIDIKTILKDTLTKNVNKLLNSVPFNNILKAQGMEMQNISNSKNTETTQRWKIELQLNDFSLPLHTKIEFSRRAFDDDTKYESIDSGIIRQYSITPFMTNHYSVQSMFQQKIHALAMRNETQARDIFDLYMLTGSGNQFTLNKKTKQLLAEAKAKAALLTFEDFKGQVIAYLTDDCQEQYDDKSVWQSIVDAVIKLLDEHNHEIN